MTGASGSKEGASQHSLPEQEQKMRDELDSIVQPTESRSQNCPSCTNLVTMVPYDIGSGPEMSCPGCEWCWGADGQPLKPIAVSETMWGSLHL